ncbi:hypothetical protein LA635_1057 [Erwinia amylovora LA635]|nr:hypothetical protein LA635_1057 [Erwinia amylovora LA635]CDK18049.1 hypothetical protein LA636_1057 [Erwinia amylovora LA636]CDK21418.1 hypothetical protein LA637_1058 [Erwinia amylovora LA637]
MTLPAGRPVWRGCPPAVFTAATDAKKPAKAGFFTLWLGCRDSNPGMLVSETRALPLGDTPIFYATGEPGVFFFATYKTSRLNMAGVQGFEPRNAGIRNQSLTTWRHPNKIGGYYGNRTCDPSIMSAVL